MTKNVGDGGHSAATSLPCLSLRLRSLNRRICGSAFGYAQICSANAPQTSHIPGTLGEIPSLAIERKWKT